MAHSIAGLPYSLTLHGQLSDYGGHQKDKWSNASFATIITNELAMRVAEEIPGNAAQTAQVSPMGVDLSEFRRCSSYIPWTGDGPLRVVSCARLNVSKGHDVLLKSLSLLRREGLDVRLVIIGEDEDGGTGYRRRLEALIGDLGLGDYAVLAGSVGHEDVRAELEAAHIFALASHAEPLGVAIMEAMALEMPVVVTRSMGVSELVVEGAGIMVPPGVPNELARALSTVANDPHLALNLGRSARARVEAGFGSIRSAKMLVERLNSDYPDS
ncbi:glycosyltransferase involved in cell wall biosynthesis [Sinomonas atrocyanea]|nr:glycosyltransferase involved in cell wall biosynthesis [Sinomonas atrocyanea]